MNSKYRWKDIRIDYEAGMSIRALETKHGPNRGTISKRADSGKWVKPPKKKLANRKDSTTKKATIKATKAPKKKQPRKKAKVRVAKPPMRVDTRVDQKEILKHYSEHAVLEETLETLDTHSAVAKNAAVVASEMITRAHKLIDGAARGDSPVIHAAANLLEKATRALGAANHVFRKNRGLEEKNQTEVSGSIDLRVSPEEWRKGRDKKPR